MKILPQLGYTIIENEMLPIDKIIVDSTPTSFSAGKIIVPNFYKWAIGLLGIGDDIIELCCRHAVDKVNAKIDYMVDQFLKK